MILFLYCCQEISFGSWSSPHMFQKDGGMVKKELPRINIKNKQHCLFSSQLFSRDQKKTNIILITCWKVHCFLSNFSNIVFFVWYATNFLQILVGFRFHFSRKRLIILYIKTRYKNSNIMSCDDKITSEVSSLSLWVFYVFRQVIQGKQQRTNITIQLLSSCLLITIIFINLLL